VTDDWKTLRLERDGHVARLVLDRPDKLNAFSTEMWDEMRRLGAQLCDDPHLRALVVIGEGRAFSSGIDTSVFTAPDTPFAGAASTSPTGSAGTDPLVDVIAAAQDAYTWLEEAPFATIAAVRGYALGAGLQCALACDIRIVARGTRLGLLELKYGMLPDLGGTQRLPRLVGPGKAKELIWTGAQLDAEEAHALGICERVVDDDALDAESGALARRIAAQPPLAVRGSKRAIDHGPRAGSMREALRLEAEQQSVCLRSSDLREAMRAFVEGRDPVYEAR
jgi:enoyl-CoA hydratase/carnithine racemase